MVGLIVEKAIRDINESLGVENCFELSLLIEGFLDKQIGELSLLGVDEFIYFGKSEINTQSVKCFNDCFLLKEWLSNTAEKNFITVFSNVFFELNQVVLNEKITSFSSVCVSDGKGNKACYITDLKEFLEKGFCNEENNVSGFFLNKEWTVFPCAERVIELKTSRDYKNLLQQIVRGETSVNLPCLAEGIYAIGDIPEGDFTIIPPVAFGENVQIESGCVIGPQTIVGNNSLISYGSIVRKSVLLNDTFVSGGCFLDDVLCGAEVCLRRNSSVFSNSVIGKGACIFEDFSVESDSYIRPFTQIGGLKEGSKSFKLSESLSGFCGYTPEKASLLGCAFGSVLPGIKVGIMYNGEINAALLKLALISGFGSTGVECFDFGCGFSSQMLYLVNYFELDYGIFIDGAENGTVISFINKNGEGLSKDVFYSVKDKMKSKNISFCEKSECKWIRKIKNSSCIYSNGLMSGIKCEIDFWPVFNCTNKKIKSVLQKAVSRLNFSNYKNTLEFFISDNGKYAECRLSDKIIPKNKLCDFVSFYSDNKEIYCCEIWRYDAVYLCFRVLEILSAYGLDLAYEIENIPSFYIAKKVFSTDKKLPFIASKLSEISEISYKNDELKLSKNDLKLKVINDGNFNKIKVFVKGFKAEMADEFIADIEKVLKPYIDIIT